MTFEAGTANRTAVAVVGIGCRFPGHVSGPQEYWRLLIEGRDAIGPTPSGRFDTALFAGIDGMGVPALGGYLDDIDRLDASFFGMSPREAERLDPQQRLLLETAWEAIEDAGQDVSRLAGSRGGIFVGQWLSDFEDRLLADPANFDFFMTTGSGRYAASGRLSAQLGWQGPSLTIDTACSSSLTAVHLAARSIQNGESEIALAAGVNVILAPHVSIAYGRSGMLAADGHCKFGDAAADGYVRSEGAAVVVLKPLQTALHDGDRVYAVILGGAVNNDGGSSGSLGRPSRSGQEAVLRTAIADAGLKPHQVAYVEAHGTGTRAGDPVEIGALGAVMGRGRPASAPLLVGSAKTNIGHTEAAAGLAGLIKAVLAIHHGFIPPSLGYNVPSPRIPWAEQGCRVVTSATPWPAGMPRIAGASSYGISGTNAHILVGEAKPAHAWSAAEAAPAKTCILPLSARSPSALRELAGRYAQLLTQSEPPDLADVCRNAALRRSAMEFRAAFVRADRAAMAEALSRYAAGEPAEAEGHATSKQVAPAFILPGQGAQWPGMAQGLLASEPVFSDALERCDAAARPYIDWSIVELVSTADRPDASEVLQRIDVIQPTLVALSIAYAALLASRGVRPGALAGHSMGEVAAAHLAGIIDLDMAMRLICRRSALMAPASGKGAMALVELSLADARACIADHQDTLAVAAQNGSKSCVLSGAPEALASVLRTLEADGVFVRPIKVDVASHSPQMQAAAASLEGEVGGMTPTEARVPVYSTVLGRRAGGHEFGAAYWGANLTNPVLFADVVSAMAGDGISTFIELGPHPILLPSIQQSLPDATVAVCGQRDESDTIAFARLLATLWTRGTELDWAAVLPGPGNFVRLPTYPWQRERHWLASADLAVRCGGGRNPPSIDAEQRSWLHELDWQAIHLARRDVSVQNATWLLIGEGATADGIQAALEKHGAAVRRVPLRGLPAALAGTGRRAHLVWAPGYSPDPYLPVALLRELSTTAPPLRTWIVTSNAQGKSNVPADVRGAALWGAARVIAEERPELSLALVDVQADDPTCIDTLVERVLGQQQEDQIVIRGGTCFGLRLIPLASVPEQSVSWRPDAAYLITGGHGDIGFVLANAMVEQGARRLVLMGRSPLPERSTWLSQEHSPHLRRRIEAVRALEARGASIHVAHVDVTDETALARYLSAYAAEGWPAIKGVVHAAGLLANCLAQDMTQKTFRSVLEPKLTGAVLLDRLLPELDLFVLMSSTGCFLPQPGQANYAAANAGLEAVAQQRRTRGQKAVSVAWGVWEGTGLVSDADGRANVAEMERHGYHAMPPRRAAELFSQVAAINEGAPVVCRMDWPKYVSSRAGRNISLFEKLPKAGAAEAAAKDELASMDPPVRRAATEKLVREAVGHVLKIAPGKLAADKTFGSMGLTSLVAMELRNRLEKALGRPLSATLAWNYPTIDALADHLAGVASRADADGTRATQHLLPAALQAPPEKRSDASLQGELAAVDSLSEEDAFRALQAGRSRRGKI